MHKSLLLWPEGQGLVPDHTHGLVVTELAPKERELATVEFWALTSRVFQLSQDRPFPGQLGLLQF